MQLDWLEWSNPVAIWWVFLVLVSVGNIGLFLALAARFRAASVARRRSSAAWTIEPLLLLAAAYVFGCAFRAVLPRADVLRICLFDTSLSSVLVGRSVATAAEISFVAQWAIVLYALAHDGGSDTARKIAKTIVPLVLLAEGCSWYAVITTDYLGNVVENSLWTAIFLLVGIALVRLFARYRGAAQFAIAAALAGIAGYVVFMCTVNVPMYIVRWQAELAGGQQLLGLVAGFHDLATRWIVTRNIAAWDDEIAWMSLYFSVAVWASLLLAGFGLVRHLVPRYLVSRPQRKPAPGAIAVPVRSAPRLP